MPNVTHLECSLCAQRFAANQIHNLCSCGGALLVRYDLDSVRKTWTRDSLAQAKPDLWRYWPVLPVNRRESVVSLGEGMTPLIETRRLGAAVGAKDLWVKDEGLNPTGTFKARGAAVGISRARQLGATTIALPTAGNAGAAWAAYGARAGIPVVVAMPKDAPSQTQREVALYGARLHLVDGNISHAGAWVNERAAAEGWYDASTFKEPYRLEGKKTLGLEIAEQLDWRAPDVILYPTGGGVGLLGLWKAFAELRALGWLRGADDAPLPRLVVVQAAGCAPVVRAWDAGAQTTAPWEDAATVAAGLRVPSPLAGGLMLRALRETGGTALAVEDDVIRRALGDLARAGLWLSPEGAALLPALRQLRASGWLRAGERVVLLNTGSGLVYPDVEPLPPPTS